MVILQKIRTVIPNSYRFRLFTSTATMAKSKFEYVRDFEVEDQCLPNTWIVVRIDGKGFHKFSDKHNFIKPNDDRGLALMSTAAQSVMKEFKDIMLSYGQSDEYSFVFKKNTSSYNRRASKLMTNIVSLFASSYVMNWQEHFPTQPLLYPPAFDARVVLYPSNQNLRDYLSWRQADCHINNLYNTIFWKLVLESKLSPMEAQEKLKGTVSADKNEMLFTDFNTNYNDLPQIYRKGTVIVKEKCTEEVTHTIPNKEQNNSPPEVRTVTKTSNRTSVLHEDIIGSEFWKKRPYLLGEKK